MFYFSDWKHPSIRACAVFVWSLSLRSMSQSTLSNSFNLEMSNMLEQDETLMESALADKVFLFMKVRAAGIDLFDYPVPRKMAKRNANY